MPETGHDDIGETGESAKKRYTNDFGLYLSYMYDERLQGVCNNNIEYEAEEPGDLIKAYRIISGNEASGKGFFELAPNNAARGHRCEFFNKRKGTYESSVLASIHMNLTYDGTASVDNIAVFKRTLRETFY